MDAFEEIADPEDVRVAPYRDLKSRDALLSRHGIIVQGLVALERAAASGLYPLGSVLIADRLQGRLGPWLETLGPDVRRFAAPQHVLDRICGFPLHRGVLAYGPRPELPAAADLLRGLGPRALVACVVGINDPENMGALFRNAAAFGATAVVVDSTACDPLSRRAIRVSVGAALCTPCARLSPGEDLIDLLQAYGVQPLALSPSGALSLKAISMTGPTALLVGAEGPGLPDVLLARCRSVRIPMAGGFDSLNVATALAVALHHLG